MSDIIGLSKLIKDEKSSFIIINLIKKIGDVINKTEISDAVKLQAYENIGFDFCRNSIKKSQETEEIICLGLSLLLNYTQYPQMIEKAELLPILPELLELYRSSHSQTEAPANLEIAQMSQQCFINIIINQSAAFFDNKNAKNYCIEQFLTFYLENIVSKICEENALQSIDEMERELTNFLIKKAISCISPLQFQDLSVKLCNSIILTKKMTINFEHPLFSCFLNLIFYYHPINENSSIDNACQTISLDEFIGLRETLLNTLKDKKILLNSSRILPILKLIHAISVSKVFGYDWLVFKDHRSSSAASSNSKSNLCAKSLRLILNVCTAHCEYFLDKQMLANDLEVQGNLETEEPFKVFIVCLELIELSEKYFVENAEQDLFEDERQIADTIAQFKSILKCIVTCTENVFFLDMSKFMKEERELQYLKCALFATLNTLIRELGVLDAETSEQLVRILDKSCAELKQQHFSSSSLISQLEESSPLNYSKRVAALISLVFVTSQSITPNQFSSIISSCFQIIQSQPPFSAPRGVEKSRLILCHFLNTLTFVRNNVRFLPPPDCLQLYANLSRRISQQLDEFGGKINASEEDHCLDVCANAFIFLTPQVAAGKSDGKQPNWEALITCLRRVRSQFYGISAAVNQLNNLADFISFLFSEIVELANKEVESFCLHPALADEIFNWSDARQFSSYYTVFKSELEDILALL